MQPDCSYAKRKETMMKRYGAPTTMQSKELSSKAKQTLKTKYGCDNPMKCKAIQEKHQLQICKDMVQGIQCPIQT